MYFEKAANLIFQHIPAYIQTCLGIQFKNAFNFLIILKYDS